MSAITDLLGRYNLKKASLLKYVAVVGKLSAVLFSSYIAAGILATIFAGWLSEATMKVQKSKKRAKQQRAGLDFDNPNYLKIQRAVLERNVFNSDGEVPPEEEGGDSGDEAKPSVFDVDAACNKPSINAELVGTIYLGESSVSGSIATIQEKGYPQADVYKVGDLIIGNDAAVIAKIEKSRVVINNGGTKECLDLAPPKVLTDTDSGDTSEPKANEPPPVPAGDGGEVSLEASYVEQQVGEGGGNILNQGRLVPFNQDGAMKGFKLISLKPGGLFDKIGLKNGDVITQVNDTSLQQPDQGFAFYQAFENETEIRINYLRNASPKSLTVKVK